ncbi:MAG: hypothetical protein HHAS10_08360 [Candidatus Altimarinota bacterium]
MNTLYFSPYLTQLSVYFLIITSIIFLFVVSYGLKYYRYFFWRFSALLIGVLFFEFLTSSLWVTAHLGTYGYLNGDVSLVLSFFWASLIFSSRILFDKIFLKKTLLLELGFVLGITTIFGLLTITLLKEIEVFSYSKEMQEIVQSGITLFGRPLEALIYFPTFVFVTYSFYKYWELAMYNKLYFLNYSIRPTRDIFIVLGSVIAIGYLMHPLLVSNNFYTYPLLCFGALIFLIIVNFTIASATHFSLFIRYVFGTLLFSVFFGSLLSYLLGKGWIQISESLKINYTEATFFIPGFHFTDSEAVGIMFFSYLLIAIVKYYKVVFSHKSISIDDSKMTFRGWKSLFSR